MTTSKKRPVSFNERDPFSIAVATETDQTDVVRFPELQVNVRSLPKAQALSVMGDYNESVSKTTELHLPPFNVKLGNIDSGRDDVCANMRELSITKPPKVCKDKTMVGLEYLSYTESKKSREKTFEQTISCDVTLIKENVKEFLVDRKRKLRISNTPRYKQLCKLGLQYLPSMAPAASTMSPCHKIRTSTETIAPRRRRRLPFKQISSSSESLKGPQRLSRITTDPKQNQTIWQSAVKASDKCHSGDVAKPKISSTVQSESADKDVVGLDALPAGYVFVKPVYRRHGMPIITLSDGACSLHSETARAREYARTLYPNFNWTVEKNERLLREKYLDVKPKPGLTYVTRAHTLASIQPQLAHLHYIAPTASELYTFGIHDLNNIPLSIKMGLANFSNTNELPRSVLNNLAVLARGSYTPMSISPLKNPPPTSHMMHALSNVNEDDDDSEDEQSIRPMYQRHTSEQHACVNQEDTSTFVQTRDQPTKRRNADKWSTPVSVIGSCTDIPNFHGVDAIEKPSSVELTSGNPRLTALDERPEISVHVHTLKLSLNSTSRSSEMGGKTTQATCTTDGNIQDTDREKSSNAEIDVKPEVRISNKDIVFISPAL